MEKRKRIKEKEKKNKLKSKVEKKIKGRKTSYISIHPEDIHLPVKFLPNNS